MSIFDYHNFCFADFFCKLILIDIVTHLRINPHQKSPVQSSTHTDLSVKSSVTIIIFLIKTAILQIC